MRPSNPDERYTTAKAVSCTWGLHANGTEEGLVAAVIRHVEEGHGKKISREQAASQIQEKCSR